MASSLNWANEKYERFLKRRFPRFYILHHTLITGKKMNPLPFYLSTVPFPQKEYSEYLENNEERKDTINASFNLDELKPAINTFRVTSPGKDQISYVMLSHLSKASLEVLLELYNRVWLQGQLPRSWKLAVMVQITPCPITTDQSLYICKITLHYITL